MSNPLEGFDGNSDLNSDRRDLAHDPQPRMKIGGHSREKLSLLLFSEVELKIHRLLQSRVVSFLGLETQLICYRSHVLCVLAAHKNAYGTSFQCHCASLAWLLAAGDDDGLTERSLILLFSDRFHRPQLRQQVVDQQTQARPRRASRE